MERVVRPVWLVLAIALPLANPAASADPPPLVPEFGLPQACVYPTVSFDGDCENPVPPPPLPEPAPLPEDPPLDLP